MAEFKPCCHPAHSPVYQIHTQKNRAKTRPPVDAIPNRPEAGRFTVRAPRPVPSRRLQGRQRLRTAALLLTDVVMLTLAWFLATALAALLERASTQELNPLASRGGHVFVLACAMLVLTLATHGHYTRRSPFWEEVRETWRFIGLLALTHFAVNFFAQVSFMRTVTLLSWLMVALWLPVGRLLVREGLIRLGYWNLPAMVVGQREAAREVGDALARERHMGVVARDWIPLAEPPTRHRRHWDSGERAQADSMSQNVARRARLQDCEAIVVALDAQSNGQTAALVNRLHAQGFEVFVVPALSGLPVHGLQTRHLLSNDLLIMRLQHQLLNPSARRLKRAMDMVLSGTALLLLAPLMAWVAWRIHREDGGPALFRQTRVGAQGRDFSLIKFRSMVQGADDALATWPTQNPALYVRYVASNFKLADDPRLLKTGAWIRCASIDELPQLWNVLRGDMSLVGPRPLLRRELDDYPLDAMDLYERVRPGITGLWQVSGRSRTSFEQRANLDSWYVRNWSLWIDWVVLFKTVRVVLARTGAV